MRTFNQDEHNITTETFKKKKRNKEKHRKTSSINMEYQDLYFPRGIICLSFQMSEPI